MARSGRHRAGGGASRGLLVLFLILVLLSAGAGGLYLYGTGASGPSQPISVDVPDGATAEYVGRLLEEREVIRSALAFRLVAAVRGVGESLQAGTYDLRTNMTISEALDALEAGPVVQTVDLTVPEGLELGEIAGVAARALPAVDTRDFERSATGGEWALPPYLPEGTETVEGFLFPKTYEFPPEASEDQVINRLLVQFEAEAAGLDWSRAEELGLMPYEVVVVASLIEREARVDEDRSKVSAVIHNRLEEGMPLQIDATVQYALPEENRELTFDDYEVDSPYNTYLHPGLPPTPIASPGLASLRAALDPADADYLYFVVIDQETGEHAFAETYEEFLRLKDQAGL
jgi:UPF0755 protein